MTKKHLLPVIIFLILMNFQKLSAQQDSVFSFDKKIEVPGNGGYDYLSIDSINRRLYVSHGTQVNVIDLNTEKVIGSIDNMQGVHGIAIVNDVNRGFISDGKADAVIAFDLKSLKKITTIKVSKPDADGIIYDPFSKKYLFFAAMEMALV